MKKVIIVLILFWGVGALSSSAQGKKEEGAKQEILYQRIEAFERIIEGILNQHDLAMERANKLECEMKERIEDLETEKAVLEIVISSLKYQNEELVKKIRNGEVLEKELARNPRLEKYFIVIDGRIESLWHKPLWSRMFKKRRK